MPLSPGSVLGPYSIDALIGEGGMGEVYRARDTRLDRMVAIKVLSPEVAQDPDLRGRFEREARTVAGLSHPHICPVYNVGEHEGTRYLVMEHLQGESLAERLGRGALPLDQALEVAGQVAEALATAHHAGVVHRDLKPANVMLTKAGAKLLDFGLAKLGEGAAGPGELTTLRTQTAPPTEKGTILGTFQYMAPEQLEGQEAEARSDIFAFGALIYELVTGQKAFEGKSRASLIAAILERHPPPVSSVQTLSPIGLDRVVSTCLAKDPEARWQSIADVGRQLEWLRMSDASATPTEPALSGPRDGRRPTGLAAALVAAVLAGGSCVAPGPSGSSPRFPVGPDASRRLRAQGARRRATVALARWPYRADGRVRARVRPR